MKARATAKSSRLLADLMDLGDEEREWVLGEYWRSLDGDERESLRQLFSDQVDALPAVAVAGGLADLSRERLLEDPGLTAGEKVLLSALYLKELYELQEFHGRQITAVLREVANPVNNITAALNGLISKGEAEVANPGRAAKNAHKRYRLTTEGLVEAATIARMKGSRTAGPLEGES